MVDGVVDGVKESPCCDKGPTVSCSWLCPAAYVQLVWSSALLVEDRVNFMQDSNPTKFWVWYSHSLIHSWDGTCYVTKDELRSLWSKGAETGALVITRSSHRRTTDLTFLRGRFLPMASWLDRDDWRLCLWGHGLQRRPWLDAATRDQLWSSRWELFLKVLQVFFSFLMFMWCFYGLKSTDMKLYA